MYGLKPCKPERTDTPAKKGGTHFSSTLAGQTEHMDTPLFTGSVMADQTHTKRPLKNGRATDERNATARQTNPQRKAPPLRLIIARAARLSRKVLRMKIKLNIDKVRFTSKPKDFPPALRKRLCNEASIREVTPEQLIESVKQGLTFTPAVMTGTTGNTWQSQQVICADIDNDTGQKDANGHKIRLAEPLTPEKAGEVMAEYGIDPYFMYYSFSNAENWPKFRIVLVLDEPITDPNMANDLIARFTGIFNRAVNHCADTTASDNARLYYGGRADCIICQSGQTTPISLLQGLPSVNEITGHVKTAAESFVTQFSYGQTPPQQNGWYRPYSALLEQFNADKENFNLAAYIEKTTDSKPVKKGKTVFFNPCPLCGHKDDFQVTGSLYHCHGANGRTGGTIIDYLMNREGLTVGAACDKFKYEIMGYDREEWRAAYIADKRQNSQPQPANNEKQQRMSVKESIQDVLQEQPLGLLTLERAISILEAVDDHYLKMPRFKSFCDLVKLKTHDTVVLAADTGAGKSSLALNFLHELQDRYPILYINLEMDEATILQRLVSIHTGISLDQIEGYKRDEDTRSKVNTALQEITARKEIQLIADVYDLAEIEKQIQTATQGRTEPTIVFLDTGLLVKAANKSASRYERFTHISEELRRISRLNNIILFVLLQQNREGKKDDNKEPSNSSLKESGSWENDATKIMFLWQKDKANNDSKELTITKNRSGKTDSITLDYFPHTQTYSERENDKGIAVNMQRRRR